MAQSPQYVNWLTGQPGVLPTVTSGAAGFVPAFPNDATTFFRGDGTYNTPPTVTSGAAGYAPAFPNNTTTFFRGDGTYNAIPFPTPPIPFFPISSTYTVQSSDYLKVICSQLVSGGATLTLTIPTSLPNGFMFWVSRVNNTIILTPTGGPSILSQSLGNVATVTMSTDLQLAHIIKISTFFLLSF